jgi:cation diffusion facilitator CzcD-associated flavoprotein CzcO
MEPSNSEKRVLLIGAGLTGICVLRRLSENKDFKLTCFERNYDIGGQWLYTDQTVEDGFGRPIQTAMYKNVR